MEYGCNRRRSIIRNTGLGGTWYFYPASISPAPLLICSVVFSPAPMLLSAEIASLQSRIPIPDNHDLHHIAPIINSEYPNLGTSI